MYTLLLVAFNYKNMLGLGVLEIGLIINFSLGSAEFKRLSICPTVVFWDNLIADVLIREFVHRKSQHLSTLAINLL